MLKEFKEFITRGSVIDMAIGIVMGGAFGAIITSVVEDIIMPIVGYFTAGVNFADLAVTLGGEGGVTLGYGKLIQAIINFIIIGFFIFLLVKGINKLNRKAEAEEAAAKSDEVLLLEEIRDSLKK